MKNLGEPVKFIFLLSSMQHKTANASKTCLFLHFIHSHKLLIQLITNKPIHNVL